ncbi:MAG: Hpt domain-containing protein [Treponema sp.]|nr:Hpt domain-containing protein [Treponema sp.]
MADSTGTSDNGVVYVDLEEGLKRIMHNTKLYVRLLTKFKSDADLEGALADLAAGNYEGAQVKAHTLKGIAANLSLSELYRQTLDMETQIKAGSVDPSVPAAIRHCFSETVRYVDKVIAQYG